MQIIPSILIQSKEEFIKQAHSIEGAVDQLQLDIADGKFVPNKTWADPDIVSAESNLNIELHLMVEYPQKEIKKWKNVSQIRRILFHFESVGDIHETIELIHSYGWEASIALNPDTPLSAIDAYAKYLDGVLLMGVYPGFQGQEFIPETLSKIDEVKDKYPDLFVELDGGVNLITLPKIAKTKVDGVNPGSATFGGGSPDENIKRMKSVIEQTD